MKLIILSIAIVSSFATSAWAHSGGTNDQGCHTNHSNGSYHCH
ncbi:YHYH domain-containing protein [Sinorhizobium meliloti]|nr:YHYH domain-containing protein [Sinorhizobium meliloti]RVJ51467.1 YHYH domain-containing protein [Sinorhizobium meliloti]